MTTKKKFNIRDYFKNRSVKQFSLFFMIAFVFLIISKLSNDYKQTIKLKVNLINVENEILIENDSANFIYAYVEAKGFSLLPLIFQNYKELVVDSKTDVSKKSDYFKFDVQKHKFLIENQLSNAYNLISVLPDTLLIAYATRASKLVPVSLKKEVNYAVGYDLKENFTFNIDSVKIVGATSEVNKIDSVVTEALIMNDVKNDILNTVKLDISSFENIEVFPKEVKVSGKVARFTEGIVEVPITISNQPQDIIINYFPKTVNVAYYVDLEYYNAIKASDFKVACDYADLVAQQTYLVPKVIKKPDFVKHVNIKQKRIEFIKL
ncbi:YbbR-like domain-containing protein [Winogradskyella bathintestinalis]|uniref:YbbR-like domain-containing protein n=1 Tax=Winogradskyella bathintestinalis TaxID=3035208 RepID=A0ABT7ZYC5_9FLAO|nr:YbbR-like domain-containing protein [Winogradskyella bathintestinalis]MDN3494005.1 YbbR-like domain-containing protein [Winogradskyella bathintestinalis]